MFCIRFIYVLYTFCIYLLYVILIELRLITVNENLYSNPCHTCLRRLDSCKSDILVRVCPCYSKLTRQLRSCKNND